MMTKTGNNVAMEKLKKKIQILLNLYKSKNLPKALLFNKELILKYPTVPFLYNSIGLILTDLKKIDEAIVWYKKGLKLKPDYAMIYNNLGTIYKLKDDYKTAESYYRKSIYFDKKLPEPQNNLGSLYFDLSKYEESIKCYKNSVDINPNFFQAHYNLGIVYKNVGNFEEAKNHLNESIRLSPYLCSAHRNLSLITKYTHTNKHFDLLKKIYKDNKINDAQKTEISFSLGKAYEDIRKFDEAFNYYKVGNELRGRNISFSIKKEKEEFENIKKIFNKETFLKFNKLNNHDSTAIFIVGMPRSGTTLIEQILSSHPKVFGGDELNFLPNLIKKYFKNTADIIRIKDNDINIMGNDYIKSLKKISNNSEKVSDKLPINFKWIGLIKLILPNSKIVHCYRNPKDNCLSIYKNYFVNPTLNFAYNLKDITSFYNLYKNLMMFWKNSLPNFIIDIEYEKLIQNPEKIIRDLIKDCNLNWDDKCLNFHDNKRPIKTASDSQARKKIYRTSLNLWRNYEKHLANSFKNLTN